MKKRNSEAAKTEPHSDSGKDEKAAEELKEAKPQRRKSILKVILDKRRERVEAGNNYYNLYGGGGFGGDGGREAREYDPKLGVDNLPLRGYSGLFASGELVGRGVEGSKAEGSEGVEGREGIGGRSELAGEEIGVALSGDEDGREEREVREGSRGLSKWKGKGRDVAEARRGGYWGDYPRYGGNEGGRKRGNSRFKEGEFEEPSGTEHAGQSGGDHDRDGGNGTGS